MVRKATFGLALALLQMVALAATADASSVRISQNQLRFSAGNEANRVFVASDGAGGITIEDRDRRVRVGAGCTSTTRSSATCAGGVTKITIAGSGGDDTLAATFLAAPITLDGAGGDDLLIGGGGNDTLAGGDGNDTLMGLGGSDNLTGGGGTDLLVGGPNGDTLHGGAGTDTVDYSSATGPLTVDLDGNADDGEPGEKDRVEADVERVVGGPSADRIAAISGNHTLDGGPGNDILAGGTGTDTLIGGPGDDTLNGGVGSDDLRGGDGVDMADYSGRFDPVTLDLTRDIATTDRGSGTRKVRETDTLNGIENGRGSSHADLLLGGPGANTLIGGRGADTLDGRFGPDVLIGGGGRDVADYSARRAPVTVTIDGQANDGGVNEGDDVEASVEDVRGGGAGDHITGGGRRNHLFGGDGRDTLVGLAGADLLDGGPGGDQLDGGDGRDELIGGPGRDLLLGGGGNDVFGAQDARPDGVECGDGIDRVAGDSVDRVAVDCERVSPRRT